MTLLVSQLQQEQARIQLAMDLAETEEVILRGKRENLLKLHSQLFLDQELKQLAGPAKKRKHETAAVYNDDGTELEPVVVAPTKHSARKQKELDVKGLPKRQVASS